MKHLTKQCLIGVVCGAVISLPTEVMASAFQLWEQDGASPGNYHAGYAAEAADASTAFYNPAGIIRFKNQQLVIGAAGINTHFQYAGNINVFPLDINPDTSMLNPPQPVTAQGGNFTLVPDLHYVAPINENVGFGLSVDAPFGLKTNYHRNTLLKYAATLTSVRVVDISPSLGIKLNDKASIGFGIDIQRMHAEFDQIAVLNEVSTDTDSTNKGNDTGYGYHLGALYQFTPDARVGLSYHSQVVHHLTGTSLFNGPLATLLNDGYPASSHLTANMTLPPYTALSGYYRLHPKFALMGSVIYTQWNIFKDLILNGVSGISQGNLSPNIQVVVPAYYHNTWNAAFGADYFATDKITLRSGIGYDQTPVSNTYRTVQLPDNDRYVIALGAHYQATNTVGMDVSWMHVFFKRAYINPPPQVTGDQITTTDGHVDGRADVVGVQLTWDLV